MPLPQLKRPDSDDDTAEGGAVTAQELGDRVNNDVGTVFEGTDQVGGGQGCVHDQGNTRLVGDLCEAFQVATSPEGFATISV